MYKLVFIMNLFPKASFNEIGLLLLKPITRKLIGYLYHHNTSIKYKSATALAEIKDNEAAMPMFETLKDEPINSMLAFSLSKLADDKLLPIIVKNYKSAEPTYKSNLAIVLSQYSNNEEVLQLLISSLNDFDPNVRYSAVLSLGEIGNKIAVPHLLGCLADVNEWIFYAVLQALVKLKDPKSANPLCALYLKENNERKRAAIIKTLGKIKEITSITVITKALKDPDNRVVANALEALYEFELPKEKIAVLIHPYLQSNDNRIKGNAVLLALKYEIQNVYSVLQEMTQSLDKYMRATAGYVLSKFRINNNIKLIKDLVEDENFLVKKNALTALYLQSTSDDLYEILSLLEHNQPIVRIYAVKTLAKLKIKESLDYLHKLFLNEQNIKVKSTIISSLKAFEDKSSVPILNKAMYDADSRIRANAIEAVSQILGNESFFLIKNFVKDIDYRIKANAILSMLKNGYLEFAENLYSMLSSSDISEVLSGLYVVHELGSTFSKLDFIPIENSLKHSLINYYKTKIVELQKTKLDNLLQNSTDANTNISKADKDKTFYTATQSSSDSANQENNFNEKILAPESLKYEAMQLYQNSEYKKALEKISKYTTYIKDDLHAYLLLGNLHYQLSNFEEAILAYSKVLQINPSIFQANFNIANAYYQIGDVDTAIKFMVIAHNLQPNSPSVSINLANLYMRQQRWLDAIEMYEHTLKFIQPNAKILANIAFAYQKLGNYLKACENYHKAIQQAPNDAGIYYNFGLVLLKLQRAVEAKAALKQALKLLDKNSSLKIPILELLERIK